MRDRKPMGANEALQFINEVLTQELGEQALNDLQQELLRGVWVGKSYKEIHRDFPVCGLEHLSRNVASQLWQRLSKVTGEKVRKTTVRTAIARAIEQRQWQPLGYSTPQSLNPQPSAEDFTEAFMEDCTEAFTEAASEASELHPAPQSILAEADGDFSDSGEFPDRGFPEAHEQPQLSWVEAPDTSIFYGRKQELQELDQRIRLDGCRLLVLCGTAGVGKTLLASKLGQQVKQQFKQMVWKSLRDSPPLPLEHLIADLMRSLTGSPTALNSPAVPTSLDLVKYLFEQSCLIVLDSFETVLLGGDDEGRYCRGYEAYRDLILRLGSTAHQSCVVLTTREKPQEVATLEGPEGRTVCLTLQGLKELDAQDLLESKGLWADSPGAWLPLMQACDGNPRALQAIASQCRELFDGNAQLLLRYLRPCIDSDILQLQAAQWQRLSRAEQQTLQALLQARQQPRTVPTLLYFTEVQPIPEVAPERLPMVLQSLLRRSLVTKSGAYYAVVPLMEQYLRSMG